jgi:RND family efflux transporter, MFP subunit
MGSQSPEPNRKDDDGYQRIHKVTPIISHSSGGYLPSDTDFNTTISTKSGIDTESDTDSATDKPNWEKIESIAGIKSSGKTPMFVMGFIVVVITVFGIIFALGVLPRLQQQNEAKVASEAAPHLPSYAVSPIVPGKKDVEVNLPANIQAVQEFNIYARCDGYLARRLVDIGDRVRKGQLLMQIDAPELEKQLMRSKADYKEAQAQLKSAQADLAQSLSVVQTNKAAVKRLEAQIVFSNKELRRYQSLASEGAVSVEMRDEKLRDLSTDKASLEAAQSAVEAANAQAAANQEKISAARANVDAAKASVEEIETMNSWQRVVAPCDGVITARNVDAGALVSKGSSSNNQELLRMARTDTLRVFVYIPQSDYQGVHVGMPAKITVAELPNQTFDARIANISGGMDPTSRTLQAKIEIPNQSGKLMPGMFAQVSLISHRASPPVLVPDSAVIVKPEGQYVVLAQSLKATVQPIKQTNAAKPSPDVCTAHYVRVNIGRDLGKESEVISGISVGDSVITQPPSDISEGQKLKIETVDPKAES